MDDALDHRYGLLKSAERSESAAPLLPAIDSPADLRRLPPEDLPRLAGEIRDYLVSVLAEKGGHFAPSLGVVELTIALHRVFDTPTDRIVWDVGHQGYVHKILTGRRDQLPTIRQYGGISGFLKRSESPHDPFGAGHASTAISAALGMATGRDLAGDSRHVVAVLGDGAMTGGLTYEGLNNIGASGVKMLVILNDNAMSISPNVGAIAHYLTTVTTNPYYRKMKDEVYRVLGKIPSVGEPVGEFARRMEAGIKGALVPGAFFQSLGFTYYGPIDGHDLSELVPVLDKIRSDLRGPTLLHVLTQKGKGYAPAEADPDGFHGVSPFDPATGTKRASASAAPSGPSYTEVFGEAMVEQAARRPELVGISAAMLGGTGLKALQEAHPERCFDVGIAEGHGVTFAAGLASEGQRPVCAIYSTFLQRAFDHMVHDVALQKLPVIFALDRAGLVGADGPTHHGVLDLTYLRCVPDMVVAAPKDADELRDLLETALEHREGPFAIRYPRGASPGPVSRAPRLLPLGSWELLEQGQGRVALLAVGAMLETARGAARLLRERGLAPAVVNARFVKPLDEALLDELQAGHELLVTLEENVLAGGFGDAVGEHLHREGAASRTRLLCLGIPDRFVTHGSRSELLEEIGLSDRQVADRVLRCMEEEP
jgi:1-deoxy-D-xylulose-5-phosphate synthase